MQEIRTLDRHSQRVTSLAFSPDGKTLVSGSWDRTVKVWNLDTGSEISRSEVSSLKYNYEVNSVAFSPDSKTLASGSGDKTIKIWDITTESEV